MNLRSSSDAIAFDEVVSFVGEDATGSFGIMPGHPRFMTCLVSGLARFRCRSYGWRFLATPGAVLYFERNLLSIATQRFLLADDYQSIAAKLGLELKLGHEDFQSIKQSLAEMERELKTRVWQLGRGTESE